MEARSSRTGCHTRLPTGGDRHEVGRARLIPWTGRETGRDRGEMMGKSLDEGRAPLGPADQTGDRAGHCVTGRETGRGTV